ncbi:MAG: sugar-binding domain-containing protein [Bacteroides cellulosilyticus]
MPQSYKGRTVSILFDGIFQQSDVYINGKHLGHRPYGFCSIEYDLTPYLHTGKENVIAVRVNTYRRASTLVCWSRYLSARLAYSCKSCACSYLRNVYYDARGN